MVNCSAFAAQHDKGLCASETDASSRQLFNHQYLSPMPKPDRTAAILVAAGRGLRAGSGGPKQYRLIGGENVVFPGTGTFFFRPQGFSAPPGLYPRVAPAFRAPPRAFPTRPAAP